MPQKTIYVKDADLPLMKRAESELGVSLSALFAECLKEHLERAQAKGGIDSMSKLSVTLWNQRGEPSIHKSFVGRWLVAPEDDMRATEDDVENWDAGACWAIAQTRKGSFAVYSFHCNGMWKPSLEVCDSLDDLQGEVPESILAEAASELRVPYEIELDI